MTTHSSILAGRIPQTEATGRLQSLGSRTSELICHIWLLQHGPSWFLILIVDQHILSDSSSQEENLAGRPTCPGGGLMLALSSAGQVISTSPF